MSPRILTAEEVEDLRTQEAFVDADDVHRLARSHEALRAELAAVEAERDAARCDAGIYLGERDALRAKIEPRAVVLCSSCSKPVGDAVRAAAAGVMHIVTEDEMRRDAALAEAIARWREVPEADRVVVDVYSIRGEGPAEDAAVKAAENLLKEAR